jgi:hypothetical protein
MSFCKIIKYLGWASGAFGGLLMLAGVIGFISGGEFLGVKNYWNYFYISTSFLLLGIFLVIATHCCCCCTCEEEKQEEKKE